MSKFLPINSSQLEGSQNSKLTTQKINQEKQFINAKNKIKNAGQWI